MATIERLFQDFQDLLAPVDTVAQRARAAAPAASAAALPVPDWFGPQASGTAQWDWFDAAPSGHAGLEVTEHAVPAGWFARTFGVAASPAA